MITAWGAVRVPQPGPIWGQEGVVALRQGSGMAGVSGDCRNVFLGVSAGLREVEDEVLGMGWEREVGSVPRITR